MALITRFAISFYKFMLYEAVLVFANSDILVNLLTQNGLFLYFLSCKLLKIFISAPSFPKIDGFENLALKIDGFDRTHRTRSDATTASIYATFTV